MTADIEMLPLPEADDSVENHAQWPIVVDSDVWLQGSVQSYARDVAEHNIKRERARADRLAEALRELVELKDNAKHQFPNDYETRKPLAWEAARAALRDHDKEGKDAFWPKLPGSGGPDWTGHD